MECPACQHPIHEHTLACPECRLTLEQLRQQWGTPPACQRGVNDFAKLFSARDTARVQAATDRLSHRFPQIATSVITARLPANRPVHLWSFYLLNHSGLCAFFQQGGRSRDVVLVLDSTQKEAALTIGYGLEPFVSQSVLQESLEAGHPCFARRHWVEGIEAVLAALEQRLTAIALALPPTYGITPADWQPPVWPPPSATTPVLL